MWRYVSKVALTVLIVVALAEQRSSFWGAVLASLPLKSTLVFVALCRQRRLSS
jgi:hypothetical protein